MATYQKHNPRNGWNILASGVSPWNSSHPAFHESAQPTAHSLPCRLEPAACRLTPAPRRGVILLVLLGILALFGATAFAFLVIASHAKQTSQALKRVDRVAYSPRDDLEEAMRQALRDTNVATSVLQHNSLLEDLYGGSLLDPDETQLDALRTGDAPTGGWVINSNFMLPAGANHPKYDPDPDISVDADELTSTPTNIYSYQSMVGGGQLIEFTAGYTIPAGEATGGLTATGAAFGSTFAPRTYTIPEWFGSRLDNNDPPNNNEATEFRRRVGCVLTVVDPESVLYNKSTRIVGYRRDQLPAGGPPSVVYHRYQVLPFQGVSAQDTLRYFHTTESSGYNFVINGTPFSGKGAGYDPSAGSNSRNTGRYYNATDQYFALLPNPTDPDYYRRDVTPNVDYLSANEDYDAPDYQNMLLAMEQWDGTALNLVRSPSLHRPALVNFWLNTLANDILPGTTLQNWQALVNPDCYPAVKGTILRIKRRCLLRPLSEDHPNFDGSNPNWPTASSPYYDTDSVLAINDIPTLQAMARYAWGAADLASTNTVPWFEDLNSDGLPDTPIVPWDVDNDGDGIPDSVWVDIGLPVRTLADGSAIKPLVAFHCIDLDGKLNLNVAGSLQQLNNRFTDSTNSGELLADYFTRDGLVYAQELEADTGPDDYIDLLRGQGCGTPEINLYHMFLRVAKEAGYTGAAAQQVAMTVYRQLLLGREMINGSQFISFEGRNGELWLRQAVLPALLTEVYKPAPGQTSPDTGIAEARTVARMFGYPNNYFDVVSTNIPAAYGSPLDLKGAMTVGSDLFGQPIYSAFNTTTSQTGWISTAWQDARIDIPYELLLGSGYPQAIGTNGRTDNPFTIAELEPLLRRHDTDVLRLPQRLLRLLEANINSTYRFTTTTESWDLPVPSLAFPPELLDDWRTIAQSPEDKDGDSQPDDRPALHITDLIAARAQSLSSISGILSHPTGEHARRIDTSQLLPPEVLMGLRLDLNRPFGNGLDDDGNGVVDEPGERFRLAANNQFELFASDGATYRFDHDNDGFEWRDHNNDQVIDSDDHDISLKEHTRNDPLSDPIYSYRQQYAKYLYVLMMGLVDEDWFPYWDTDILQNDYPAASNNTNLRHHRARARAIAQWAVNVVDFRDADSIMTPFEYDIYPFANNGTDTAPAGELLSTWEVDGNIETVEPNNRDIVWGCERPELLITETLAFHDRRTEDLDVGQTVADGDMEWDQRFRPQGSFFVELYNPWSVSQPKPAELNSADGVQLDKATPDNSDPVWRLAVCLAPNETYIDPDDTLLGTPPTYERLVYFLPSAAANPAFPNEHSLESRNIYHPSNAYAVNAIAPNSYAIIGPGDAASGATTFVGTAASDSTDDPPEPADLTNVRRLVLDAPATFANGTQNDIARMGFSDAVKTPTAVVVDLPRRLSVSEPTDRDYVADTGTYDPATGYAAPFDRPEDMFDDTQYWDEQQPEYGDALQFDATTQGYRYVHLQRLANPLQDFNEDTNPYITIDSSVVDLTVFNGQQDLTPATGTAPDPDPSIDTSKSTYAFYSRQRGEHAPTSSTEASRLWISETPPLTAAGGSIAQPLRAENSVVPVNTMLTRHIFQAEFGHSLGYLNDHYYSSASATVNPSPLDTNEFAVSDNYKGAPGTVSDTDGDGDPDRFQSDTFPWLTWFNRPFANPMELLQVPAVCSSRLLRVYQNDNMGNPPQHYREGQGSFTHLAGFFSALSPASGQPNTSAGQLYGQDLDGDPTTDDPYNDDQILPSHFYRLFEYVQVPTRFVSAYIDGRPSQMVGQQLFDDPLDDDDFGPLKKNEPPHAFHPPFNNIPTYREPGKVNVNTIAGHWDPAAGAFVSPVWDGLINDHGAGQWTAFAQSRQGYEIQTPNRLFDFENPTGGTNFPLPTRAANPFRSFAGADLVPPVPNRSGTGFYEIVQQGVNTGLTRALFDTADPIKSLDSRTPMFINADGNEYMSARKNPFFRYQSLQRLSNLVTSRSNVYALWITVGYFEAERVSFEPEEADQRQVYTEGYTIGQELGANNGDISRHRAFYVIDRSIPVGFVRGEDLNTENAVLIRRFIE